MNGITTLVCQSDRSGREERIAHQVAMLEDMPLKRATLEEVRRGARALISKNTVPIGSVEFVRSAMAGLCVSEPENISYPVVLMNYLRRRVDQSRAGSVFGRYFVKPVTTKAFTGFVFDSFEDPESLCSHDREQYECFIALPADTPVWISEPVRWVSEVRYYVLEGNVIGKGRYDDGADEAQMPDEAQVLEMVKSFWEKDETPVAFALDAGVLEDGETALVEVNDAWALGYYSGTLSPQSYIEMLSRRWAQITSQEGLNGV